MTLTHNNDLSPLPTEREIAVKVMELLGGSIAAYEGVSADQLANALGVQPARRLPRRASKGNWSGSMSPSVRLSPRLRAMARAGLLREQWDFFHHRNVYYVGPRTAELITKPRSWGSP